MNRINLIPTMICLKKLISIALGLRLLPFVITFMLLSTAPEFIHAEQESQPKSDATDFLSIDVPFNRVHPTYVITREDIQRTGATYMSNLLLEDGPDFNELGIYRSMISGSATVAILLNGKPVSSSTVNDLPVRAIERIEILGHSAATTYDNYDINGAINVITRRDSIHGIEFWADIERPSRPGGEIESKGMLWSPEADKTKMVIGIEHWKQDEIRSADRDYSKSVWEIGGAWVDAVNVSLGGNTVRSLGRFRALGSCDENYYTGVLNAGYFGTICGFPYANYAFETDSEDTKKFFFNLETELSEKVSLYSNLVFAKERNHFRYAPSVGTFDVLARFVPGETEYGDDDTSLTRKVTINHRFIGHGNRDWNTSTDRYNFSVGLKNHVEADYQYDVSLFASSGTLNEIGNTFVSQREIEAIINNPPPNGAEYDFVNPLSTDPDHLAAIKLSSLTLFHDIKTSTTGMHATVSGNNSSIGKIPIRWKTGIDYARIKRTDILDHRDSKNKSYPLEDILGSGGSSASGKRHTWSAFGESIFAVLPNLDISGAGRYERHSDTENTFASQIAARVSLTENIQFRTAIGQSELAPGFADLYRDATVGYPYVCDVVLQAAACNSTNPAVVNATRQQYQTISIGSSSLKPVEADTFNVGLEADFNPLSVAVNYVVNDRKKIPTRPTAQEIVNLERVGKLPVGAKVERIGGTGPIEKITIPLVNDSEVEVKGIDLRSRMIRSMDWGELDVGMNLFHTLSASSSIAGRSSKLVYPKNRMNLRLTGSRSKMSLTWNIGAISSFWNSTRTGKYKSWLGHDLIFNWQQAFNVPNLNLRVSVINLTDEKPIVNPFNASAPASTTPISSIVGRTIGISAEMKW